MPFVPKEPDIKSVRIIFKQNSVLGFKSLLPRPQLDRLSALLSLQKPTVPAEHYLGDAVPQNSAIFEKYMTSVLSCISCLERQETNE